MVPQLEGGMTVGDMVNFGINYIYFMCYYDAKQIDINQICKESTSKDVNVFQVMMTGGMEYLALKKDKSFHTIFLLFLVSFDYADEYTSFVIKRI